MLSLALMSPLALEPGSLLKAFSIWSKRRPWAGTRRRRSVFVAKLTSPRWPASKSKTCWQQRWQNGADRSGLGHRTKVQRDTGSGQMEARLASATGMSGGLEKMMLARYCLTTCCPTSNYISNYYVLLKVHKTVEEGWTGQQRQLWDWEGQLRSAGQRQLLVCWHRSLKL